MRKPLDVKAAAFAWGYAASNEQQLRAAAVQPHYSQVLRGVVGPAELEGCSGELPVAVGLVDANGKMVHAVLQRRLPLLGGSEEYAFDGEEVPVVAPEVPGRMWGVARPRWEGRCRIFGCLSLSALGESASV